MDSLNKKTLKTLQLTDWASFIEDVNYNFSVLLSSPLFVGTEGADGSQGMRGAPGVRGSKWFFVDITSFQQQFSTDLLQGEYQITLDYLNKKLLNETSKNKLLKACSETDNYFVDGDIVVSNSKLYYLNLSTNKFIDTGDSISANSDVFLSNIEKRVIDLVNQTLAADPVYMGLTQTVTANTAQAKNYVDNSGNTNNQINDYSMIDILSSNARNGAPISTHKMYSPAEKMINADDNITWLIGTGQKFHDLVQRTLSYNANDPTNTVSSFGPTYKNSPAFVILQNTYNAGAYIGHKNASNFTEFGRFYISEDGAFTFTSPNASDHYLQFSQIKLYDDLIELISKDLNIKAKLHISGNVDILPEFDFIHEYLKSYHTGIVHIGKAGQPTNLDTELIYANQLAMCDFLSIDTNHKIVAGSYAVDKSTTLDTLTKRSDRLISSSQLNDLYTLVKSNLGLIIQNRTDLEELIETNRLAGIASDANIIEQIETLKGGYTGSLQTLKNDIDNEVQLRIIDISGLQAIINAEISNRSNADILINEKILKIIGVGGLIDDTSLHELLQLITQEISDRATSISNLQNALSILIQTETDTRSAGDISIRGGYTGSMQDIIDMINNISNSSGTDLSALLAKINQEISNRTAGDTTLQTNISAETAARLSAFTTIRGGYTGSMQDIIDMINNISNSSGTDLSALLAKINQEISNRTIADSDLLAKINQEISNRTAGDTNIRGGYSGSMKDLLDLINTITGGSATDLSELIAKINAEISNRTAGDTNIRGGYSGSMKDLLDLINTITGGSATDLSELIAKINQEISNRTAGDTNIRGGYSGSMKDLLDLINTITGGSATDLSELIAKINAEISNRTAGDTNIRGGYSGSMKDLLDLINTITGGSTTDLSELIAKINAEISNRTAADTSIRGGYANSMKTLYDLITSNNSAQTSARTTADTTLQTQIDALKNTGSAAPTIVPGTIVDLYVSESGTYDTIKAKLFSSGRGKSSVTYSTPVGSTTQDLSHYWLCDGSNGTPNLVGRVTAGASSSNNIGSTAGADTYTLNDGNLPPHWHDVDAISVTTDSNSHKHGINLYTSNDGSHTHGMYYGTYKWGDNASNRDFVNPSGTMLWSSGVMSAAGSHEHIVSGISGEASHAHAFSIPTHKAKAKATGANKFSLLQPTLFVFKCMYF